VSAVELRSFVGGRRQAGPKIAPALAYGDTVVSASSARRVPAW
jgi:hypothetical protein